MKTETISMYSINETAVYFNSTEAALDSTVVGEVIKWTDEEIARSVHVIVRPTLIVIGTIGNGLSFYVMRRTSLKELSSCFYMAALAVADTRK